jgi:hypothetical protein
MEFIEKAIFQKNAHSVFSRDDFLKILEILDVPSILPDEEGVEYHATFEFKGETRTLIVRMEKTFWSVPYFTGDDYDEYEVIGYEIFTSH